MLVSELINILEDMDPDQEIVISYPSNDYWRTQLKSSININSINEVITKNTSMYPNGIILNQDEVDDETYDPEEMTEVVAIICQ